MNYAGHEKLRAEVAELANNMSDLRDALNDMEHLNVCPASRFSAPLPFLWRRTTKFLRSMPALRTKEKKHVRNL